MPENDDKKLKKGLRDPDTDGTHLTRPGEDSLPTLDTTAEVEERDYTEGQRRRAGHDVQREE